MLKDRGCILGSAKEFWTMEINRVWLKITRVRKEEQYRNEYNYKMTRIMGTHKHYREYEEHLAMKEWKEDECDITEANHIPV